MADSKFGQHMYNKSGASCSAGKSIYYTARTANQSNKPKTPKTKTKYKNFTMWRYKERTQASTEKLPMRATK